MNIIIAEFIWKRVVYEFYSYNYVLGQISQQNWVTIGISGTYSSTGFFCGESLSGEAMTSKFREVSIISILTLVAVVLIQYHVPSSQSNDDPSSNAHSILLRSPQRSWMSKRRCLSILQQPQMGAIWRLGGLLPSYRDSDPDSYQWKKMDLLKQTWNCGVNKWQ